MLDILLVLDPFDWALMVNLSINGVTGIVVGLNRLCGELPQVVYLLLGIVLLAVGVVYQAREMRVGKGIIGLREPIGS